MTYAFEPSGKIKPPSAEELALADENTAIIAYTSGAFADGTPYYAYVVVPPSKYAEFHAATSARESIVLSDYGEVLAADTEAAPPESVVAWMQEYYGIDPCYEEKLAGEARKQRDVFMEKQETQRIDGIVAMLRQQKNN